MMIRMSECVLTVGSAVSEERHQKRNVVNVLQMRTDLVDTTRKFGLKEGKTQTLKFVIAVEHLRMHLLVLS